MGAELPAATAAKIAIQRQNFALTALRNATQVERDIATIVDQNARSAPVSSVRGSNLNIRA